MPVPWLVVVLSFVPLPTLPATPLSAPLPTPVAPVTVDIGARDPSVSPDGRTLAVSILGKIWTLPMEGGTATQVTFGSEWDSRPAWSPDGRFLAYAHRGARGTDLVLRTMATGGERVVHRAQAGIGQIAFAPAGEHIYFIDDRNQYDAHLWRVEIRGGQPEQLTATQNWHEWSFALSPDADRVVLESGRYGGADLYSIALGEDGRPATRLTESLEREMSVALSPDGRTLAYVRTHNGVDEIVVETVASASPGSPASPTSGSARVIDTSPFDQKQLAFLPGGDALVLVAGRRLFRLDLASGTRTAIPFSATFQVPADPPDDLFITDVRLFDATGDEAIPGASVLVRDGRIARIWTSPVPASERPAGVPVIEGGGRTLLPGLMDNHLHFWAPAQGPDLVSRGVTAVRDPGVALADGLDFKDAVRHGLLQGPDIYTAGPLLDGPGGYHPMVDISLDDPAAAAPLVRALKAQGVDALKAYFLLDRDVLAAVVAEAEIQGLPVTGHIGVRTSWNEAIDAGIDGFSHVRVWRDFLPPEIQPDGRDFSLDSSRNPVGRMQADWSLIDVESSEVRALIRRMAETGTAIDPTLLVHRIDDNARGRLSLEEFTVARESYAKVEAFVRDAVEAGVPLLAGTDNVPLMDELEAYRDAGIPSAEILKAATINGARWIGHADELGTIEVGKRAHMILVDGDPLDDVAALRNLDLVVKDGVIVFRQ